MTSEVLDRPESSEKGVAHLQIAPCQSRNTGKAPTLILMAGFAGAGKTTLANRLSRRLNLEILNKDILKLKRLAQGEKEDLAGWNAFEELMQQIEENVMQQRKSVIIDTSNEKPFIYENVQHIVEQLQDMQINAQLHIILCVLNKKARLHRLKKRGSVFAPYVQTLPTVRDDAELRDRFKHLPADKVIVINTLPPVQTCTRKVLKRLKATRKDI